MQKRGFLKLTTPNASPATGAWPAVPSRALKIVKCRHTFKENANWSGETINEIYRQAESGGVLLSSMGNPKRLPVLF